jgi:hypothetical protein
LRINDRLIIMVSIEAAFPTVDDPMDTLVSLRVFCTIAELKSFTPAADRFRLPSSP